MYLFIYGLCIYCEGVKEIEIGKTWYESLVVLRVKILNIGTRLLCKKDYCAGDDKNYTKGEMYIISDTFQEYYVIYDNKGIRWDFNRCNDESFFSIENYFYTLKEVKLEKLSTNL